MNRTALRGAPASGVESSPSVGLFLVALTVLGIIVARVVAGKGMSGSTRRWLLAVSIGVYSVLMVVFLLGILLEGNCSASSEVWTQYESYLKAEHLLAVFAVACLAGAIILVRRNAHVYAAACLVAPPG